jgi:hypothetical protein
LENRYEEVTIYGDPDISVTQACAHLGLTQSSHYERPGGKAMADAPVIDILTK